MKIWQEIARVEVKCLIATKILEKISEFQKEDNINNLTKQTLFDHLSNNNTRSARVNAACNTKLLQESVILSCKQHITKLFKNLQEA